MKLAFCLFKYFPFGGLQRDFLRIAKACQDKGYQIQVYTMKWEGDIPDGFKVTIIPVTGFSNHRRCQHFVQELHNYVTKERFDAIIGFNRLPHLDIYFAGDLCFEAVARQRHWLYRLTPRYRTYAALERAVFERSAKTHILLIAERERQVYQHYYGTQAERFHLLPPGLDPARKPAVANHDIRNAVREELGLAADQQIVLMIGSSFATKGVDRALLAFAALPDALRATAVLINIGQGNPKPYLRMANDLKIADKVHFLGPRLDVQRFLSAADVLLHPSYYEAGGVVLLEALVSGLPIVVTGNCGYAYHVQQSGAGVVIDMPFTQDALSAGLAKLLQSAEQQGLRAKALAYAAKNNFYQATEQAVAFIEAYLSTAVATTGHTLKR